VATGTALFVIGVRYREGISGGPPFIEIGLVAWFGIAIFAAGAVLAVYSLFRLREPIELSFGELILYLLGMILVSAGLFLTNSVLVSTIAVVAGVSLVAYVYLANNL
jgi:hypothetical protein